jgi:hypothetical protein
MRRRNVWQTVSGTCVIRWNVSEKKEPSLRQPQLHDPNFYTKREAISSPAYNCTFDLSGIP